MSGNGHLPPELLLLLAETKKKKLKLIYKFAWDWPQKKKWG